MPGAERKEGGGHRVEAVERALTILEAFGEGQAELSLTELAERTGLYPSTILRLADSLRRFGYLYRDPSGRYSLGPSLWRLGSHYHNAFDLGKYVRPVLAEVVRLTGQTSAFYIRQGDRRLCLYRHHSPSPLRYHIDEGVELPLNNGSDAHILMAFTGATGATYDEVRAKGYCLNFGKNTQTGGAAAPVFGVGGAFVGALGVWGLKDNLRGKKGERVIATLLEKAKHLSGVLGSGN